VPIPPDWLDQFESFIRRDPGRRGLLADDRFPPLLVGHLGAAAADLAATARSVAIVTGFFIPAGNPPAAETDGPLGSMFLAQVLERLGIRAWLVTDEPCRRALECLARAAGFPIERVLSATLCEPIWRRLTEDGLTHLIALERVGPCHTLKSLSEQTRPGLPPSAQFETLVAEPSRDRPHNMRGDDLSAHTAPLHSLFELARTARPLVRTIGIGDGGNEIGMGSVPWEDLVRRLTGEHAARVPCRIGAEATILAGVSNWGGYALAAATAIWRRDVVVLAPFTAERERTLLERLVEEGPAVDGVTRRQEPSVDGLPFLTYIQPLQGIRRVIGFAD
jgi:D-glutamate cyclase